MAGATAVQNTIAAKAPDCLVTCESLVLAHQVELANLVAADRPLEFAFITKLSKQLPTMVAGDQTGAVAGISFVTGALTIILIRHSVLFIPINS